MENKNFPPPSPIEVRTPQGNILSVNPIGAKITLALKDTSILTSVTRGDGKPGITHPCSPIFGPDKNDVYGLPQHGNMRNESCVVTSTGQNEITVSHDISDPGYPEGMKVTQVLKIEDGTFSLSFTHKNTGNNDVAVNAAEHCYFDAPQGYTGATINGRDIASIIQNSPTGVVIDLQKDNIIKIPGKPDIILKQKGFNKVALWIYRNPDTGKRDKNYICIEPIEFDPDEFGSEKSMIPPGGERTAQFSIALKDH